MPHNVTELDPDQSLSQESQAAEMPNERPVAGEILQARRQCVQKYLTHSLAQNDPLRAGFGAINADLMAVAQPIADVLKRGLSGPSLTIDGAQKMMPLLDAYHRLTRMIERFGQLDVRIAERKKRRPLRRAADKPR